MIEPCDIGLNQPHEAVLVAHGVGLVPVLLGMEDQLLDDVVAT